MAIHLRHMQSLSIELQKMKVNLSNEIINLIFSPRMLKYNLLLQTNFSVPSSKYGLNSLRFFASKVWQMIQIET